MKELERALLRILRPDQLRRDEPMASHTTMRVGGAARLFVCPKSPDELLRVLLLAREAGAAYVLLGNGSNLIVRDGGISGLVIHTGDLDAIRIDGHTVRAMAGASLPALSSEALRSGLAGLEFASGIPGSVGGAVAMNAGAYGEEISMVLSRARVLLDGLDQWLPASQLQMGYRSTRVLSEGGVVLEAEFALSPGDPQAIQAKMNELNARRRDKQPLHLPSAGSTFKRPDGHFAGALIESAGLKGLSVGGAQVSEKHAGFIVNAGGATARDLLSLIELVQQSVLEQHGVQLQTEVRVIGED